MKKILLFVLVVLTTWGCNLSNIVDIDLPEYTSQPVVECYVEPGKPFRLLLTRSFGYFDTIGLDSSYLDQTLLQGALVTISYNNRIDTLYNSYFYQERPYKIYNYFSSTVAPTQAGMKFTLRITLPGNEGEIYSETAMLPPVSIEKTVVERDPGDPTHYRVLTYVNDNPSQKNFYRMLVNYNNLESQPDQNILLNDEASSSGLLVFGTPFNLQLGDSVVNTVYVLDADYYDFLFSVHSAKLGNLTPIVQPSTINSNVSGSANPLGIFTSLVYDRKHAVVQ